MVGIAHGFNVNLSVQKVLVEAHAAIVRTCRNCPFEDAREVDIDRPLPRRMDPIPLFGPVPGGLEMTIILLVAVLLFGANKLPELARSTGSAKASSRRAASRSNARFGRPSSPSNTTWTRSEMPEPSATRPMRKRAVKFQFFRYFGIRGAQDD
jgi:sec-independent protein translocase protein TatA